MEFFKRFSRETNPEQSPSKELRQISSLEELKRAIEEIYDLEDLLDTFLIQREAIIREATNVGDGMTGQDRDLILRKAEVLVAEFEKKGFTVQPQLLVDCPYSL